MDGCFVPNISFGADVIKSLRKYSTAIFDCHLMISSVDQHLQKFVDAGCDIITIHAEASTDISKSLKTIRDMGKKAGVAINPATPIAVLEKIIDDIDMIIIMTVNPGLGGQKLIDHTIPKIKQARSLINGRSIELEVDGGVKLQNIGLLANAGANLFVAGSEIFNRKSEISYEDCLNKLKKSALKYIK
ncbi:Ribulose-phosphate 3-epimerase [Candidatus Liberibacter americanus str. Sao Paulo]|uniref:Ribulose-phosphate 3-epimerase n=2 Tax=Candidatus Liberibacter americanus TaxID=309868 RepID=U6B8E9_9HYPH|nr:Ribulose-phosphate 3-epimerase [Candidatus Liberibacter americanus str. Sao Paulo]